MDRWFRVTGERFDWIIKPGLMRTFRKGEIYYGTRACLTIGLQQKAIEVITRPQGAFVGKDGQVYYK